MSTRSTMNIYDAEFIEHEGLVHGKNKDSSNVILITQWMYSSKDLEFCMWTIVGKVMASCIIFF